jgi:hypothetical protein
MRVFAVVSGLLVLLIAAALIAGAFAILNAEQDSDDFFVSDTYRLERASFAITGDSDVLNEAPAWFVDWFADVVDVRVAVSSSTGGDLFVGVASTAEVEAYLANVAYDEVTRLDLDPFQVDYQPSEGSSTPVVPGGQGFWVASAEGSGTQRLDWSVESGTWSVVVVNADAARWVSADLVLGVRMENINTFMWIGFGAGLVPALLGLAAVFGGIRSPRVLRVPPAAARSTADGDEHVTHT